MSADTSLVSRILHEDPPCLKYTGGPVYKGALVSREPVALDYRDVEEERYRQVFRRLERAKQELSQLHSEILELFIYDIIAENHSPYDAYTKIRRLSRFLKWLENQGKDITTCTGFDISRYLVQEINPSNRHRIAADIKRFVRFLKEKIDESFEKLYKSFKVKKPSDYPIPPLPTDELLEKILQYSTTFYRALFTVLYEGGLRPGEALSIRIRHVEDHDDYIKIIVPRRK